MEKWKGLCWRDKGEEREEGAGWVEAGGGREVDGREVGREEGRVGGVERGGSEGEEEEVGVSEARAEKRLCRETMGVGGGEW